MTGSFDMLSRQLATSCGSFCAMAARVTALKWTLTVLQAAKVAALVTCASTYSRTCTANGVTAGCQSL